jgi:hypothetical protein
VIPLLLIAAVLPQIYDGKADPPGFTRVPAPAMKMRMNEATATRVPWIDANGWRFERGLKKAYYADLPKGTAALAAAEAFAYGVEAELKPDPADLPDLDKMLAYLKGLDGQPMPAMANVGVIDDGSALAGEVLNLLGRRNILYRVVHKQDPKLNLTVRPTPEDARNPNLFAAKIREKLSDDKRLIRIYGTYNVIARLEGEGGHARVHLLNYGRQPARDVRVRVLGAWKRALPEQADTSIAEDSIEFTVPQLATYLRVDLSGDGGAGAAKIMESSKSPADFELTADPGSVNWRDVPAVRIDQDFLGKTIPGDPTLVQSRWTEKNLYLLYTAPYDELNLKPNPQTSSDTVPLWDWDVVEAFLGSDFGHRGHYAEFEVSPQGEWVDLDIDRDHPKQEKGAKWNSGFAVRARVDPGRKVWFGEMRIPFESLGLNGGKSGLELRAGLYRCAGRAPNRTYYSWSPTGQKSFHVPDAFGLIPLR